MLHGQFRGRVLGHNRRTNGGESFANEPIVFEFAGLGVPLAEIVFLAANGPDGIVGHAVDGFLSVFGHEYSLRWYAIVSFESQKR